MRPAPGPLCEVGNPGDKMRAERQQVTTANLTRVHPRDLPVEHESNAQTTATETWSPAAEHFRHSGWIAQRRRTLRTMRAQLAIAIHAVESAGEFWNEKEAKPPVTRSRIEAFEDCGQRAFVYESIDSPGTYRVRSNKCKDRFCKPCMAEKVAINKAKLLSKIKGVVHRFVTLTLRTQDEPLNEQLTRLYSSFRKLRQRAWWKQRCRGGIAFCEVKWSEKGNRWHPHLHVLIHGRYMPKQQLGSEWYAVTGDSWIVDVKLVKQDERAAHYVAKYASKGYDQSAVATDARLAQTLHAFHRKRLVIPFGDWKGFSLTEQPDEQGWRLIDTLDAVLRRARDGDPNFSRILDAIAREWDDRTFDLLPEEAPRPPPPPPNGRQTPPEAQLSLTGSNEWTRPHVIPF